MFQLRFLEEVHSDKGKAERSRTTGHLVVTLPKVKAIIQGSRQKRFYNEEKNDVKISPTSYLEVTGEKSMDFSKIVSHDELDDLPSLESIPD